MRVWMCVCECEMTECVCNVRALGWGERGRPIRLSGFGQYWGTEGDIGAGPSMLLPCQPGLVRLRGAPGPRLSQHSHLSICVLGCHPSVFPGALFALPASHVFPRGGLLPSTADKCTLTVKMPSTTGRRPGSHLGWGGRTRTQAQEAS